MKPLDADGFHALVCQVGGLVLRRHHSLRDAFAWIGRQAGFAARTEVYEPAWTRARTNAQGGLEVEQARLDNRFTETSSSPTLRAVLACTRLPMRTVLPLQELPKTNIGGMQPGLCPEDALSCSPLRPSDVGVRRP